MSDELSKAYNPAEVEPKWAALWDEKGCFKSDETAKNKPPFCVLIPPPNVTGVLTLGHVLNNTLQDVLVRFKRMQGFNTLWLPGTDHAGIATQNRVEKTLQAEEKKTRHDLGREEFLKRVWAWKEKYGFTIIQQLKRLGASCDWDRLCFTMDENYSDAVKECFVRLHEKGHIYRGSRIINWCPRCRTALSDEENIHQDKKGKLWHLRYDLEEGSGFLVVATTRPETMLGDTAVAVHPEDERYGHLIGKMIKLPLTDRIIPIIGDVLVEKEFGTGCVKVTPAHDPNDFAMGERNNLPKLIIMNADGTMNDVVPEKYRKLDRFACRKAVIADLEAEGRLVKIDEHAHSVGHCERCSTVTEPFLSLQWFVKYDSWIKPALAALESGELKFYPEKWEKTFVHWLTNIRDWCISRQLWWGHRVPAWYCDCGEVIVARTAPTECPDCGSKTLRQDEDVLDTWFSSWLWPFATLGWPKETLLLKTFYPTQTLITAADIIFFWVARMVFAGTEFMGKLPFSKVYFNSIVRDMQGRKMSKSLGNSPDPIAVMDQYGTDALRYTIVNLAPEGQDVLFSTEKCELGRHFANKIWNTARFTLPHLLPAAELARADKTMFLEDRWILSRFNRTIRDMTGQLERFRFNEALASAYVFIWNEFCDWYIDMVKGRLTPETPDASRHAALDTLHQLLFGTTRLLHPFMPFITEEIHALLRAKGYGDEQGRPLIISDWPKCHEAALDETVESAFAFVQEVVSVIRNLRAEKNIPPSKKGEVWIRVEEVKKHQWLTELDESIRTLSKTEKLVLVQDDKRPAAAASAVVSGITIFLNLEGLIDKEAEKQRLCKEIEKAEGFLQSVQKKLSNEKFVASAPTDVVDKERAKVRDAEDKIIKLKESLNAL